jgi:pimeloyl-ACP methyl ester carboxylesterase
MTEAVEGRRRVKAMSAAQPSRPFRSSDPIAVKNAVVAGRQMRFADVGQGPPIVFIHGTGGSWRLWANNIAELARSHRVVAVDLPGFGSSEPMDPPDDMSPYAERVSALLKDVGLGPATVVGHSLGGIVCLHLAANHRDQVHSLVLVDSGGAPVSRFRKVLIAVSLRTMQMAMAHPALISAAFRIPGLRRTCLGFVVHRPESIAPELLHSVYRDMRAPGVAAAIAAGVKDAIGERLWRIQLPVLLLWGERDRVLPVKLGRALASTLTDARLVTFPDTGHCPNIEQPESFNEAISDWIRRSGTNDLTSSPQRGESSQGATRESQAES